MRARLGQHMLVDRKIIEYEAEMARVEDKTVLEIGGGTGNLTEALISRAKKVVTVEKDPDLAEDLKRFEDVKVINEDFLKLKPFKVDVITGNVPYYISSPILFRLLDWEFEHALLCLQKEFAERMVAQPGTAEYGRLSVTTQLYFVPMLLKKVKKGSFRPVPRVDSAIVLLTPRNTPRDEKRDDMIRALFIHKNKTLSAAMKSREFSKEVAEKILTKAESLGLIKKRIFQLSPTEVVELVSA
jgi:16S rRNA (adenine1518-N6/adenine1519-N6)-dimethyltransferase